MRHITITSNHSRYLIVDCNECGHIIRENPVMVKYLKKEGIPIAWEVSGFDKGIEIIPEEKLSIRNFFFSTGIFYHQPLIKLSQKMPDDFSLVVQETEKKGYDLETTFIYEQLYTEKQGDFLFGMDFMEKIKQDTIPYNTLATLFEFDYGVEAYIRYSMEKNMTETTSLPIWNWLQNKPASRLREYLEAEVMTVKKRKKKARV